MSGKQFDPGKAEVLFSEERRTLLPTEAVLQHLKLNSADAVADLGAGNGYFTIPMAKKVDGPVYAVDIEPKMLALLKERAAKEGLGNVEYIVSDLENIPLSEGSVDKVMAAFVIHEVPDVAKAIHEAKRVLKPGGTLMIVEWEKVETAVGPPLEDKISSQEMAELLGQNGFIPEVVRLNDRHYAAVAKIG